MTDARLNTFEAHSSYLLGVAYRLTASWTESEDLLQEARLRWLNVTEEVVHPRAFLTRMVTRLALDWLKSARVRREEYVGPWLPEPVLGESLPDTSGELAADISVALMLTLQRLSPLERAAFLLHDVFDFSFSEIAGTLGREEAAVRQLAARGRARVREGRPRFQPDAEESAKILQAFRNAALLGDVQTLKSVLADDVVFYSDGGGKVIAATKPVCGVEKVAKFVIGVAKKFPLKATTKLETCLVNGMPGYVHRGEDGVSQSVAFEIEQGRIRAIYAVRNPEKLRHLN